MKHLDGSTVYDHGNFSGCCGSRFREGTVQGTPARKWKNQFGEGITPAKPGKEVKVDMAYENGNGILLVPGKHTSAVEDNRFDIKTIKTKSGPISISIRKVW